MFYNLNMKRTKLGYTPKQYAYARKKLSGEGLNNKDMALSVGYAPSVANIASEKIEKTEGFQNAMIVLAKESNDLVLAAMSEYKARGFKNFSNKDLNSAMNAISQAWERFNKTRAPNGSGQHENPLRKVILQRIENQTINIPSTPVEEVKVGDKGGEDVDMDF